MTTPSRQGIQPPIFLLVLCVHLLCRIAGCFREMAHTFVCHFLNMVGLRKQISLKHLNDLARLMRFKQFKHRAVIVKLALN